MFESEQPRGGSALELIGRPSERAAILAALDAPDRTAAVLMTGDAGIGKTAIWESIVAERRAAGDHVLISRATSAEARLPWVGMTDLLRTMPPTTLDSLPDVQRRALEVVALQASLQSGSLQSGSLQSGSLQTTGSETLDERMVGTALLSALHSATKSAPVLLAIDDLPYLDAASASAVTFALRRMEGPPHARLLATVRENLSAGRGIDMLALAVAGWMRYVSATDEQGRTIDVRDPLAKQLAAIADSTGPVAERLAPALLNVTTQNRS